MKCVCVCNEGTSGGLLQLSSDRLVIPTEPRSPSVLTAVLTAALHPSHTGSLAWRDFSGKYFGFHFSFPLISKPAQFPAPVNHSVFWGGGSKGDRGPYLVLT